MKKILFPISIALVMLALVILAGCSKSSTSSNNPPTAPTGFTASQTTRKAVNLTWGAAGADTFQLWRSPDSSAWAPIGGTSATNFTDSGQSANRLQYYRIQGTNPNGTSDYSYASLWTLPGAWDFSTSSQISNFNLEELDSPTGYTSWTWNQNDSSGLFQFTTPTAGQRLARVVTTSSNLMPHDGWFESKIKVEQWQGTGNDANYADFFVERDPAHPEQGTFGVFFSGDSTVIAYTNSSDTLRRVATSPSIQLLSANAWHTIRYFHRNDNWDVYIDGNRVWSGSIANVLDGSYQLYQEWQFDKGGTNNTLAQRFWIDDVANNHALPAFVTDGGSRNLDGQVTATKGTGARYK